MSLSGKSVCECRLATKRMWMSHAGAKMEQKGIMRLQPGALEDRHVWEGDWPTACMSKTAGRALQPKV
jgi:hypothetical protein